MHTANLSDNEGSSSFLDEKTSRSIIINRSSTEKDLNTAIKSKHLQPIVHIGLHTLCFIDKKIVEELKIEEGNVCEQQVTQNGDIILKIKRI